MASLSLFEAGAVTNKYKRINRYKNVFNIVMGSQAFYEGLHDNPSMECYPADYVNVPSIIGMNDHVLSVNAMIEVDFTGQVNAEFMHHHQYSAPGGQLDFVRGAAISRGASASSPATPRPTTVSHRASCRDSRGRSPIRAWTHNSS